MLDLKHKNIGATVGMLKLIHKLNDGDELPIEITKLFIAESDDCDYKHETGQCTFHADEDLLAALADGNSKVSFPCRIGECPLDDMSNGSERLKLYGKNTMNFGCDPDKHEGPSTDSHIHIGYVGWRKYWNMFKKNMFHGWIDWFKEWPSYLLHNWKINLLIVLGVFAVYYGSALAGYVSGTYF